MEKLSIIGCGTMGHSIALSAAWKGLAVEVYGVDEADVQTALLEVKRKLQVMVTNGLFSASEENVIFGRISFSTSLKEVVEASTFIIEAIPENLDLKKTFYEEIEAYCSSKAIIASNTSGYLPSVLARALDYPERFIVTHFWNPAHLIPLVEVVPGEKTAKRTINRTMDLMEQMGKQSILVKKEVLGFIGNRLQYALFREAQDLLDAGVATKEDIDAAAKFSIGRRLPETGPLMSADLGGLDVFSAISDYLFDDLSNTTKSGETLTQLVQAGKFGHKSGEGFYEWGEKASSEINTAREKLLIQFLKSDKQE